MPLIQEMRLPDVSNDVTAERLRELLDYDSQTGVFRWKMKPSKRVRVGDVAGSIYSNGYRHIGIDGRYCLAHRLAWLYVHGRWPADQLDHVDGDRANNRLLNLREASQSENNQNQKRRAANTSGFKGVSWNKQAQRWQAHIKLNRRNINLGYYTTAEAAHAAYCAASAKHHGDFGRTA